MKIFSFATFLFFVRLSESDYVGLDGIQALSSSTLLCLTNNGYSFFIGRVGKSTGQVDNIGVQNIVNANSAGYSMVDGYIFPCADGCITAANQVQNAINSLQAVGASIETLWLDVETYNWPSDTDSNVQFIVDMINTAQNNGYAVGIYTNANSWSTITNDWDGASSLPLWWAKPDGQQDISNFVSFGGWEEPAIKQYDTDVNGPCGVNMDQNWIPESFSKLKNNTIIL